MVQSSVTVYYAKFPHSYLRDVRQHGAYYSVRAENTERIQLHRSKTFPLVTADGRVECFELLVNIIQYLRSGNAHVGYLLNDPAKFPENPIHEAVHFRHVMVLTLGNI
jgi:hypothetical protein